LTFQGVGSFLGGLFRMVMPLLKKSSLFVGKELLRGANNVVEDVENNTDIRSSVRKRGTEVLNSITQKALAKMNGSGYKKLGSRKRRAQSSSKTRRSTTGAKKRKLNKSKTKVKKRPAKKSRKVNKKRKSCIQDYFG
jgi:hypothetical protein